MVDIAVINDMLFDAWSVGEVLFIRAVNSGNLTDGSFIIQDLDFTTDDLKIRDGVDTAAATQDTCHAQGGTWRQGEVVSPANVCSFSRTKCNGGEKCMGSANPNDVTPDEFGAIYRYDQSIISFSSAAQQTINHLNFQSNLRALLLK